MTDWNDPDQREAAMATKWAQAEERVAELEQDARRYRWLRDYCLSVVLPGPIVCDADKWGELHTQSNGRHITREGHDLDAEIDEAIEKYEATYRKQL